MCDVMCGDATIIHMSLIIDHAEQHTLMLIRNAFQLYVHNNCENGVPKKLNPQLLHFYYKRLALIMNRNAKQKFRNFMLKHVIRHTVYR